MESREEASLGEVLDNLDKSLFLAIKARSKLAILFKARGKSAGAEVGEGK